MPTAVEARNMELMQTLDDAWNAQDVEVFRARHKPDVVVRWPGQPEPTVGIDPAPYGLQPSLLPMMRGEDTTDRPAMTEALQTMLHDSVNRLIGLRTGKYKYIAAPDNPTVAQEVYDLDADPKERVNLAASRPDLVTQLSGQLADIQSGATSTAIRMSAEEEALIKGRLEALGYVE